MVHMNAPCHNCDRRRVGCHNAQTCPEWAAFEKRRDELREKIRQENMVNTDRERSNRHNELAWQNYQRRTRKGRK